MVCDNLGNEELAYVVFAGESFDVITPTGRIHNKLRREQIHYAPPAPIIELRKSLVRASQSNPALRKKLGLPEYIHNQGGH